ncbi:hypothetical protein V1504DRAFT_107799 [Lipomyces starkeyi]
MYALEPVSRVYSGLFRTALESARLCNADESEHVELSWPLVVELRGTRRLPTSVIVRRAADRVENVRRCRLCKGPGHNKHTCPRVLMSNQSPMANDTGEGVLPAQGASENDGNKMREGGIEEDGEDVDDDDEDEEFAEMTLPFW